MSDPIIEEYKAYYRARAEKYAGNPNYKHSYEAEQKLSHAMQISNTGEEFKANLGDLNEKCGLALTKDETLMEREHFRKHKEDVRVKASLQILEKIDSCKDVMEMMTMVNDITNKVSVEISMDEANRFLSMEWFLMDNMEIYSKAQVPDKYKKDMQDAVAEFRKSLQDGLASLTKEMQNWQKGWKMNPDLIMEHRHRRLVPYRDEHIVEKIAEFKKIVNL